MKKVYFILVALILLAASNKCEAQYLFYQPGGTGTQLYLVAPSAAGGNDTIPISKYSNELGGQLSALMGKLPTSATTGTSYVIYDSIAKKLYQYIGAIGASNLALGTATSSTQPVTNSNGSGFTLPIFSTTAGLVPGTASSTTTFLRGDRTFATIPAWGLIGNAGTVAGTNYIGTSDNIDLVFKRQNIVSGIIQAGTGGAGAGTGRNTGFGFVTFNGIPTGTAVDNTTMGYGGLSSLSNTGIGNTAIGAWSQQFTFSNYNTSLGFNSLWSNSNTSRNIGIGAYSGYYNNLDSQLVFINSFDRGNVQGDSTKSIIFGKQTSAGTAASGQRLMFNAKVGVNDGSAASGYVFTATDTKGNGTWLPPATSGTVTSFSKTDNYGITSSVANLTTTPNHAVAVDSACAICPASKPYVANAVAASPTIFTGGSFNANSILNLKKKNLYIRDTGFASILAFQFGGAVVNLTVKDSANPNTISSVLNINKSSYNAYVSNATNSNSIYLSPGTTVEDTYNFNTDDELLVNRSSAAWAVTAQNNTDISTAGAVVVNKDSLILGFTQFGRNMIIKTLTGKIIIGGYKNNVAKDSVLSTDNQGNVIMRDATTATTQSLNDSTSKVATDAFVQQARQKQYLYATTGTSTAYTLIVSPAPAALVDGLTYFVKFNVASGTNPTLTLNGLAAQSLKKGTTNIEANDLVTGASGRVYQIVYLGNPVFGWQVVNFGGQTTGSGSNVLSNSANLSGTPTAPTATPSTNSTQIATTAYADYGKLRYSASGTGAATTISFAHGLSGITSSSLIWATAKNAASSGWSYITTDATNINITYSVAPASGTNNLSYDIQIKP